MYTAPRLEQELSAAVGNGASQVVVDLSDCTFLDSTALGVLIATRTQLRRHAELTLVATDRNIRKVFEITGLDRLFAIAPTRTDALKQSNSA